ncbi:MAG: DUF6089 family protein [Ferruginibacter sp.]
MKILLSLLLLASGLYTGAQNLHITVFGGFSNYQGDLQEKRFTTTQAGPAFGAGLLYEITNKISARANFTYGKISADDKTGTKNRDRNLSFSSPITDVHLGVEYNILDIYEKVFTPYVFAGISYFHFNPSAIDSTGNKVFLQPLGTEGQGFFEGRKKYDLNQFAIPFGAGAKLALGENLRIGFEIGLRKTNTDYLDDVSTTFADQQALIANNGPQAAALSFRGDELKNSATAYPAAGAQRGSPKFKDWYYFSGLTLSFRLDGNGGGNSRSKLGCPMNIQ